MRSPFAPGSSVVIEDAPAGAKYDAESGNFLWAVPPGAPGGERLVLASIREPGKPEYYRRFLIHVQP